MIRYLSHAFGAKVPVYGKGPVTLEVPEVRSLRKGDTCRTHRLEIGNHTGTHVDAPAHFSSRGRSVSDYPADFWVFNKPFVARVRLGPGELLMPGHLERPIPKDADLVLFRSGWSKRRMSASYAIEGPGVHASMADHLRKSAPKVRAIGMDWISLSSFQKREEGRTAHRAFLCPDPKARPILLIEDMDLSGADSKLKEVWVCPLRVEAADSAPCTVLAVSA